MSFRRLSGALLAGEALLIATPLSGLFAFEFVAEMSLLGRLLEAAASTATPLVTWEDIATPLVVVSAALSLSAGWALLGTRLLRGRVALRAMPSFWWYLCLPGLLVLGGAWLCQVLPAPPEYTSMWWFRTRLNPYVVATPLMLPLFHLLLEVLVPSGAGQPRGGAPGP